MATEQTWPMYFAGADITGTKVALKKGELFPIQDKATIRGYGAAAGVKDAWTRPFPRLGYVVTVNVRSEDMARQIREQGLRYKDVLRLVGVAEAA